MNEKKTVDHKVWLAEVGAHLADLIGGTSHGVPDGTNAVRVTDGAGRELSIYAGYYDTKAEARGVYRCDWPRELHRASVSVGRDPAAAAKDLARRFVPGFVAEWDEWQAGQEDRARWEHATGTAAAALAALVPGARHTYPGNRFDWYRTTGTYGTVEVHSGTVNLELHRVPVELAARILELAAGEDEVAGR